jgi:hypothetical protein
MSHELEDFIRSLYDRFKGGEPVRAITGDEHP